MLVSRNHPEIYQVLTHGSEKAQLSPGTNKVLHQSLHQRSRVPPQTGSPDELLIGPGCVETFIQLVTKNFQPQENKTRTRTLLEVRIPEGCSTKTTADGNYEVPCRTSDPQHARLVSAGAPENSQLLFPGANKTFYKEPQQAPRTLPEPCQNPAGTLRF